MECTHDCSSCSEKCSSREIPKEKLNDLSSVKKVIAVISGKGGVGKSLVTSLMAVTMNRRGYKSAVLDADITGPSIPTIFGVKHSAVGNDFGLLPNTSRTGIDVMSINMLLENETDPVIWRGPVIAGAVKQFWSDVIWKDVDFMFVDMPPGTGDVPLTVFQSLPVDGIIVVTSPQELVSMIVVKAVKMAEMMNIPIIGLVENMSYYECPDCKNRHSIYGESHIESIAEQNNLKVLGRLPIDPDLAKCCDTGTLELYPKELLDNAADVIEALLRKEACSTAN